MSENQGISWGKVVKGVVKVTAVIAVCIGIFAGASAVLPDTMGTVFGTEVTNKVGGYATLVASNMMHAPQAIAEGVTNALGLGDSIPEKIGEVATEKAATVDLADAEKAKDALLDTAELGSRSGVSRIVESGILSNVTDTIDSVKNLLPTTESIKALLNEGVNFYGLETLAVQAQTEHMDALKELVNAPIPGDEVARAAMHDALVDAMGKLDANALTNEMLSQRDYLMANATDPEAVSKLFEKTIEQSEQYAARVNEAIEKAQPLFEGLSQTVDNGVATNTAIAGGAAAAAGAGAVAYGVGKRGGYQQGGAEGYVKGRMEGDFTSRIQAQQAYSQGVADGGSYAEMVKAQQEQANKQGLARGGAAGSEA